jgi:putative ABC transport system permease protein
MQKDLKYALRALKRAPGLTVVSILALALGIGANTAIFSVVDAVLLRPLPFPEPERLVNIQASLEGYNTQDIGFSVPEFEDLRDRSGIFESLTFYWPSTGNLTGEGKAARFEALGSSPEYFDVLGVQAAIGRTFVPGDVKPGVAEFTVISHAAWQIAFGGDPNIIGRKIFVDYDPFEIVGVLPADFHHPGRTIAGEVEFWWMGDFGGAPWGPRDQRTVRRLPRAIGRLSPGLSLDQAREKLAAFTESQRREYPNDYPENAGWDLRISALQTSLAGNTKPMLALILGAVGLVLLVCCASIANLLLAKASARRRELATRCALGAGRSDIVRQLLTESLLLSLLGGIAGLVLAIVFTPVLIEAAPVELPRVNDVGVNLGVLGFTIAVSLLTAVLAGLAPALRASKLNLVVDLNQGARGGGMGASGHRTQELLVAGQIALSLVLVVGAGLLVQSLWKLSQVDPGFDTDNVLITSIWLPPPVNSENNRHYRSQENRKAFVREVIRKMSELPGVSEAAVGAGDSIPLTGWNASPFGLEDESLAEGESLSAQMSSVSPTFGNVLRTRLVEGRYFNELDTGEHRVCLIDETLAKRIWRGESPIGRRIRRGSRDTGNWSTIVGVIGNVKTDHFAAAPAPHIYFPIFEGVPLGLTVFLRTKGDPEAMATTVPGVIESIDPELPVFGTVTMNEVVAESMARRRFALQLISAFAAVALLLAAIGIYGVTSFAIGRRTREIGIRLALGSQRRQVLSMVIRHGLLLTAAGVTAGLIGAAVLTRFLQGFLFDVTSMDPITHVGGTVVVALTTMLACLLPAYRATRVNPTAVLREE